MADYPNDLLSRPADEAARLVALSQLDAARGARRRLADAEDAETLHDLRVALRRLRTTIRSFRPQLDAAVSRKLRRRLRDLARATGATRDAEVQLAWIAERQRDLSPGGRAGLPWLIARLIERRDSTYATLRRDAPAEFDRIDTRLRKGLTDPGSLRSRDPAAAPEMFGPVVAVLVHDHFAELVRRLSLIRSTSDEAEAHAARIQAKRLRYLLEPLAAELPPASSAVAQLKGLQDLLGELHDVHVFIGELGEAGADAAAERARGLHHRAVRPGARERRVARRPRPASAGLLALTRIAGEAEERLVRRVLGEWQEGDTLAALSQSARDIEDRLMAATAQPSPEHTRRARATQPPSLPIRYKRRAPS